MSQIAGTRHGNARDGCAHRSPLRSESRDRAGAANQQDIQADVEDGHRDAEIEACPGIAGSAQRSTQHEKHQHADAEDEHDSQERQGFGLHCRRGVHDFEQERRERVAERREDADGQHESGQEGLVNGPIDTFVIVRPGETRDQHTHTGEERADEDDDNEKDLPADADRRITGEADEVADQRVIDDALEPADGVLEHGRPRDLPHGAADGTLDDRSIELATRFGGNRSRRNRGRFRCFFDGHGYSFMDLSVRRTSACARTTAGWR